MYPADVPPVSIYAGDTWSQSYEFSAGVPAAPIDFDDEGWTNWKCQWRASTDSDFFVEIPVDTSEASSGRIILSLTSEQTRTIGSGFFDLQSENGSDVKTWIRGVISWTEDITRG